MAFHDVRLPDEIEQGSSGGPAFNTTIIGMSSGQEQRNLDWSESKATYDISYGIQDKDDFDVTLAFFYARRGRGYSFRFRDWADFEGEQEPIGLGDGAHTDFQLIKTYEADGPNPYVRRITRPVPATVRVFVDGVLTGVTQLTGGIVRFTVAPVLDAVVTADFEFDVPVRFDSDHFPLVLSTSQAAAIGSLMITEVRE